KALIFHDETLGTKWDELEIPDELKEKCQEMRMELLEELATIDETNEAFLTKVLEDPDSLTTEEIHALIRKGVVENKFNPVLCGTAFKNKGVQQLLDAVVHWMPSPLDRGEIKGVNMDTGEPLSIPPSDDAPLAALAFKIMTDPYVGRLTFDRVYAGTLKKGTNLINTTKDKKERVSRLLQMHANERTDKDEFFTGDIAACIGLKYTTTGDTL